MSDALRLFRERNWLAALAAVIALAALFVVLGRWQYDRHEQRAGRADLIAANYDATPVPIGALASQAGTRLPGRDEWRPVAAVGTYVAAETLLVRNRPRDGRPGYEVLVPLLTEDGLVLVVDRGWVPAGRTGARPDAVPAPPPGRVEVVARLRPGGAAVTRDAPPGQIQGIDLDLIANRIRRPVVGAYGVLAQERPAPAERPLAPQRPDPGIDINLPYAFQWYAFALAGFVLLGIGARRETRRRQGAGPGVRPATRVGST